MSEESSSPVIAADPSPSSKMSSGGGSGNKRQDGGGVFSSPPPPAAADSSFMLAALNGGGDRSGSRSNANTPPSERGGQSRGHCAQSGGSHGSRSGAGTARRTLPLSTAKKSSRASPSPLSSSQQRYPLSSPAITNSSPARASTEQLILTPTAAIHDELTAIASATSQHLEDVWDEVGYSPEERATQLEDLLSEFRALCENKVQEERSVADQFRKSIADCRDEMRSLGRSLRIEIDSQLLRDDGNGGGSGDRQQQNLTDQLATLEATLERLRAAAHAASTDLCSCRDKIVSMHEVLGSDVPEEWLEVTSDLTQERRDAFHAHVADMQKEVEARTSAIVRLLVDCQMLISDLRVQPGEVALDKKIMGSLVRNENEEIVGIRSTRESETCTGISSAMLGELTNRLSELNGEKKRRKVRLNELGGEIAFLWEKLGIPEEDQLAFTESVDKLSLDTIAKGEAELRRLHALKAKMMGKLITTARETMSSLWEQTGATQEERETFAPAKVTDESQFTDDLLAEHEEHIQKLQSRLDKMLPILRMIEKREEIIAERMEYEEYQKDPDRLKQRGAALTRQLMKEEKMAKRIKKDLPKLSEVLERKLGEWSRDSDNNGDFTYRGQVYLDVMKKQEEEWQKYREDEEQRKRKKKQEERTTEKKASGHTFAPALPGRKRDIDVKQKGHSVGSSAASSSTAGQRPLSNASNRDNRMRHPSRSRSRPRPRTAGDIDHFKHNGHSVGSSASAPLPNASNRENRMRHPSRGRSRP